MKQAIKDRWVEALLSGEYPQGRDRLETLPKDPDKDARSHYCCLGVLCNLAAADGVVERRVVEVPYLDTVVYYGPTDEQYYLPIEVIKWAGLEGAIGTRQDDNDVLAGGSGLGERNDAPASFTEIARVIEENL
jgi:hypothetical protein